MTPDAVRPDGVLRVALVTGPDAGHLVPTAGFAKRLQAAGHRATVYCTGRWEEPLLRDGIGFRPLPVIHPTPLDADLGYRLYVRPAEMAPYLAESLRILRPDVIVSDTLTRVGGLAAAMLDLPWLELIPHPLADPSVALPPFGTGWWPPHPRRDHRYQVRQARSLAIGARQNALALACTGLRETRPAHRLVTTFPALEPPRPDWPPHTSVVGPLVWEPAATDLALPPGGEPLVLVVGSTASGDLPVDLLALVLLAGVGAGWRVVSPRLEAAEDVLPPWARAGPGRLGPLLSAASVVVAAGGHGMVAAALGAGVPLVLLPGPGDQKEVASRVARSGAAVLVPRPSSGPLRAAITRVLTTPEYTAAARRIGAGAEGLPDPVALLRAAAG